MHSLKHLTQQIHQYGFKHTLLYTTSSMLFFWSIFDGLLTYILPLKIVEEGFNKTEMGIIIGTSSIAGAAFDIILSKVLKRPNYRRIYLLMFILSFVFAIVLHGANAVWMYILAMAVWGFYWDLYNFGNADFVCKTSDKNEHVTAFGVIGVFRSLGSVIAPILAGLLIGEYVSSEPFIVAGIMLGISFLFFLILAGNKKSKPLETYKSRSGSWIAELRLWKTVGRQLFPVLLLTLLIFVSDSFFWTIGPLIAEETAALGNFSGLFLTAYILPALLFGWTTGYFTKRFGKKRTAIKSFLLGSLVISLLPLAGNPVVLLAIVFVASSFMAISLPAISGAYSDYIIETLKVEKEVEGLSDFFYNLGWVIGPILGGILADSFGDASSFSILGLICVVITGVLLKITPKHIRLKV